MAKSRLLLWLLLLPTLWGPGAGESPRFSHCSPPAPAPGPGVSLVWVLPSL